jgi:hypothetical protein
MVSISAPVADILSFLANLTDQGFEYRTIAVYKSAISQVHDPVGQTTLGNLPIVCRFMNASLDRHHPNHVKVLFGKWLMHLTG